MKTYVSTKLVQAEPANEGYRILYSDGYESWCPNRVFEDAYLEIENNSALESDKPSISPRMVEDFIKEIHTQTLGEKTTLVRAVLRNGFEIIEASSCVSVENYDEKMGEQICLEKIKDKIWMLLGFLLQTAVNGVKGD